MNATQLYRAGRLADALDAQIQDVKSHPADQGKRLFLFELLAFAGELDRARKQIDAVQYDTPELEASVSNYRLLLDAEQARRRFFADGQAPEFLAPPPEHVGLRLEAAGLLRAGRTTEARALLDRANAATAALQGQLNGKPFVGLRDCDDLFAGVLEVLSKGKYVWVPLEQIDTVAANAPKYPRDLFWLPVRLLTPDGAEGAVFLPALYPNSYTHADDQIRLGRLSNWQGADGGPVLGVGSRTFLVGDDDVPLLEWRRLEIAQPEPEPPASSPEQQP